MYEFAKEKFAELGIDTEQVIQKLSKIKISMHCWQGDDVKGFLFSRPLTGGIQATGNYPYAAQTASQLRCDLEQAFSMIAGKHKVNLHAIYADTAENPDLNELEPRHFSSWADWAADKGLGLDFNPTCFSHPMSESGFTLSSPSHDVQEFWIEHCIRSRLIGEYFGKRLNQKCVTNIWIADGYKDVPVDRLAPRQRLTAALDKVFKQPIDSRYNLDAVESKLFGIGSESYVVGSNEFYMGYAASRGKAITLDSGHFHPTEVISNKISAALLFTDEMLLHVSRPVRWDSDHVVIMDDELCEIAFELVRGDFLERVHIGLDYFDASINRIAAWVIGMRNMQKALLRAMLEPSDLLRRFEIEGDYTSRLAWLEEMKTMPFGAVWDRFCMVNDVPVGSAWIDCLKNYEKNVLAKR